VSSPIDLPIRAFLCTGCGWISRGAVPDAPPGEHRYQDARTQRASGMCPGIWKRVIVYDEHAIDALGTMFFRTLDPDAHEKETA
jgi:hypothetical protein